MGMGEPLANLQAVLDAVDIICHPLGLQLSARKASSRDTHQAGSSVSLAFCIIICALAAHVRYLNRCRSPAHGRQA